MGKDKPKTRLDKAGSRVEFIGFGAFDTPSSPGPGTADSFQQYAAMSPSHLAPVSSWTPVYSGSESDIRLLFPRISQKKDAITKVKALRELAAYFGNADSHKKYQAETLAHWAWLYHHKLVYDTQPSVRAESLGVWKAAADRIPKACTLFMDYYPELCGMLLSAQCDPDAQVASQYRNSIAIIVDQYPDWPWQQGLLDFVDRILSYGRPSAMHQALFAKKSEDTQQFNEQQRDELEERFERIVGTALAAVNVWVQQHADELALDEPQLVWFQALTSSKPSLRYRTYRLLGTCILKGQEQLLPSDIVTSLVQKVMPSEKEANNIPLLLETILVFLSKQRQYAPEFSKPLQKFFSKACYGARVSAWGPTVLPLLSFFDNKLLLLQALQNGRPLGAADTWQLQQVLVECSAFALLQRKENASESNSKAVDDATKVAQVWLKAFYGTLLTPRSVLPAAVQSAYNMVLQELAKSLLRIEDVSAQRPDCDMYLIRDWFWKEGLVLEPSSDPMAVADLLATARICQPTSQRESLIFSAVKVYFAGTLAKYQASSGAIPDEGAYRFLLEVLQYFGPSAVLDDGELDRFVMNDLLRWIIIHTSKLSTTQEQSQQLVEYDFGLLALCLAAVRNDAQRIWQSVLREIVAAKCNLDLLTYGLARLLENEGAVEWIKSPGFDQFAQETGLVGLSMHGGQVNAGYESLAMESFLKLCLGLSSRPALVSGNVISTWVDISCVSLGALSAEIHSNLTILVQLLVELTAANGFELSMEETDRILLTSFCHGGNFFEKTTVAMLRQRPPSSQRLIGNASTLLSQDLHALCKDTNGDSVFLSSNTKRWAELAWRFVLASEVLSEQDKIMRASLKPIGLADLFLWNKHPVVLFECAVGVLDRFSCSRMRIDFIGRSSEDSYAFVADVLIQLSEASADAYQATTVKAAKDRASTFITHVIGGDDTDVEFLEGVIQALVTRAAEVELPRGRDLLRRCVAIISQILYLLFEPIDSIIEEKVDGATVKEGMKLWYIMDTDKSDERRSATVTEVHYDAQAGYYFSIKMGETERLTVAERLKHKSKISSRVNSRTDLKSYIRLSLLSLIRTHLGANATEPLIGELINVLCSGVGLGDSRGIGSDHYDIILKLRGLEEDAVASLQQGRPLESCHAFWTVACSLGFGINVPTSLHTRSVVSPDPNATLSAISQYYEQNDPGRLVAVDEAALAWLTTALFACMDDQDTFVVACSLLFRLLSSILGQSQQDNISHEEIIATVALRVALTIGSRQIEMNVELSVLAARAFKIWMHNFAVIWQGGVSAPAWYLYSDFRTIVDRVQTDDTVRKLCLEACDAALIELLNAALHCQWKRHFAFVVLELLGGSGKPLFDEQPLNAETRNRLREWTGGFEFEEAEEIEEDVEIVSRWLPRTIMKEVEHWGQEIYEDTDESTTIARLLMWLCVLQSVDVCSPKDFRFRPAFLSYLSQSGAVYAALNLAVLNDEAINSSDNKGAPALLDVKILLHDPTSFEVPKLASLVLFQTIEMLPSLSRKWFEDSCPKAYLDDIQRFVEKYVAPEILARELGRVRIATSAFGAMSVTANSSTREVKATYVQDDFTLSVLISLPAAFPFRSAEVDCSNTVGVPAERLRRWSLQIRTMLNNQGGTLNDALMLWKDNVDKEFEGVEPCPVCYSVLHVKTRKLPALKCKTCQNRFHFDCLTQWFRSSGKNQCVLCQQPWQGTRV